MNVNELVSILHPETIMQVWGDDTITNVHCIGHGLYCFDSHLMSHGEHITLRVSIKVNVQMDGEIEIVVINNMEVCRQAVN